MKSLIPFVARVVSAFLAVISTFYLTRLLGVRLFGVYSVMLSTTFFLNLFTDWGFNLYGSQMLARQVGKVEREKFLREALTIKLALSVVFSIFYLIMAIFIFDNGLFFLAGLPIILLSFLNPEWICRGLMFPHFVGYRQFIFSLLNVGCFILLYYYSFPPILAFVLYTANTIISFLIIFGLLARKSRFQLRLSHFKNVSFLQLLRQTSGYFYGYLLNNINYTAGVIILQIFVTSHASGVYSSYYNILTNIITPVVITYSLFAPKIGTVPDQQVLKKYYVIIGYIIVAGIAFFTNMKFFYQLFYPAAFPFEPAISVIVALVFVFYCVEYLFVINAIFLSDARTYLRINLLGILVNVSATLYFLYHQQLSVRNSFITLLLSQSAMSFYAFVKWPTLWANFSVKDALLCVVALVIVLLAQVNLSSQYALIISVLIAGLAGVRIVRLLKNLY